MVLLVAALTAATLFLAGLAWTIQVVHYPLFAAVGRDAFKEYEEAHTERITALVAMPWAVQGVTILALLLQPPSGTTRPLVWLSAVLAAVPVAVTVTAAVPAHRQLATGFDLQVHARLLRANLVRTWCWTLGGVAALVLLVVTAASG